MTSQTAISYHTQPTLAHDNNGGGYLGSQGLNLYFGNKHILKQVEIDFHPREITALIGPSGCGKSTLLRTFNRMHDLIPEARIEGRVYFKNEDIYQPHVPVTQLRSRIGMVFQKPNPFPKTIFENISFGLQVNGMTNKAQISETVEKSLRESFLWNEVKDELKKPATRLSGGQQQRLCIARTIALNPEVILMDEPCSALDPISTGKIEDLILKLKKDYTVILVTHNMQQAQRIADNTAFMYLGEVIEFAKTDQIFNTPAEELTSNYVKGNFG